MGLIHPRDLEAFRRDEASRQSFPGLRRLRAALRPSIESPALQLRVGGDEPDVLVALDSAAMSSRAAILEPLTWLPKERVALLSPGAFDDAPISGPMSVVHSVGDLQAAVPGISVVLSAGSHATAGALGNDFAVQTGCASVVVQHGMLLPQAAPLPSGVHAVAWSVEDAVFWASGRSDVTMHVLGSQLLHRAAMHRGADIPLHAPPVYVGALHGTELPRREIERIARQFCLATGARYRPHPSETDLQSTLTHLVWKRLGIDFEDSGRPLLEISSPVVGMWSTGILEAATAGHPAWVFHPEPPDWLVEVWERYGLARWGQDPKPVSPPAEVAPAERLAGLVADLAGRAA